MDSKLWRLAADMKCVRHMPEEDWRRFPSGTPRNELAMARFYMEQAAEHLERALSGGPDAGMSCVCGSTLMDVLELGFLSEQDRDKPAGSVVAAHAALESALREALAAKPSRPVGVNRHGI